MPARSIRFWKTLDRQAAKHDAARKCAYYVRRSRHRMRYAELHPQGLCTSTGVLAARCTVVVGTRLKKGGMHLDGIRRGCNYGPPLRRIQCTLRRFLGAPRRPDEGCLPIDPYKSAVHPNFILYFPFLKMVR